MTPQPATFAEQLKSARKHLRMSQTELAKSLGISLHALHNYEQGRNPLPIIKRHIINTLKLENNDK